MTTQQLFYLRGAVSAASLILLLSLETWLPFYPGRTQRVRHGVRNLFVAFLNVAVVAVAFSKPLARVSNWSEGHAFGLTHWLGLSDLGGLIVALVIFDAWMYGWHRANHRIPFLWRFHRMHHSETDLDATTAVRFHAGEIVISTALRLGVLALLGVGLRMVLIYEMVLAPVIQFHHSNVRIPSWADRALRAVIVSPNMHRVHHSELRREHDGNYASIFSFWDRLFGSYRRRENLLEMPIGLRAFRDKEWLTLWGMLKTPLR